jgi:hypothetical protein
MEPTAQRSRASRVGSKGSLETYAPLEVRPRSVPRGAACARCIDGTQPIARGSRTHSLWPLRFHIDRVVVQ